MPIFLAALIFFTGTALPVEESPYLPYGHFHSLSREKVELVGPNVVGATGVRGYRCGIISIFFLQGKEHRYRLFDTEGKRTWLVKQIAESVYKIPLAVLKKAKLGDISIVVLPSGMELESQMGGEPWCDNVLARASGFRIEVKEYLFADWETNAETLNLILLHEATHLLEGRQLLVNPVTGDDVIRKELFAHTASHLWLDLANGRIPVPRSEPEYRRSLEEMILRLKPTSPYLKKPSSKGTLTQGTPEPVKYIMDREEETDAYNVDKQMWGFETCSIAEPMYHFYNVLVSINVTGAAPRNFVMDWNSKKYRELTPDFQKKLLKDAFRLPDEVLSQDVYKNITAAERDFEQSLLLQIYSAPPKKVELAEGGLRLEFSILVAGQSPDNVHSLIYRYFVDKEKFTLVTHIGESRDVPQDITLGE